MSETRKGKKPKNLESLHLKHRITNEWKKRLSESISGEKHWNWKGGKRGVDIQDQSITSGVQMYFLEITGLVRHVVIEEEA